MTDEPAAKAASDAADPSMEEILASIRRILNDDEAPALPEAEAETETAAATEATRPMAAEEEEDDVLILDEAMMVTPPAVHAAEPEPRGFLDPVPEPEPIPSRAEPMHLDPEEMPAPSRIEPMASDLVGAAAAAATASSVGSLVRTLSAGRATQVYAGGPTLEDIVRAELRPLLKEWLDAYLPPMVERLVRTEIERVVGRCVP